MTDTKTKTVAEELREAAKTLRETAAKATPAMAQLLIDLLDQIGLDMEIAGAEERDFQDHIPQYQRMVAELRGFETQGAEVTHWVDRLDWTAALALARFVNGTTPAEVARG